MPRLYREVEAMRLRNQLDPKRFYKKDEGEGKGIKGLPKYFAVRLPPSSTRLSQLISLAGVCVQIGTIVPTSTHSSLGARTRSSAARLNK